MSLAAKMWNRAMDRLLERTTGHKFNTRPYRRNDPFGIMCRNPGCTCNCLDVMEAFKQGKAGRCCDELIQPDAVVEAGQP